jgi:hypothetical protein
MGRSYAKALDQLLTPLGFARTGDDWVRVRGDMWACVNRQASRLLGVTVNLAMKDLETEKLFLQIFADQGAVLMPPVEVRIGEVIDGRDRWWKSDQPDGPRELAEAVRDYGLPWFDAVHTLEQQAEHWFARKTALTGPGYAAPSLIRLALTLYRMGELDEARQVVSKPVPRTAVPSGVQSVAKVREWLERQAPSAGAPSSQNTG